MDPDRSIALHLTPTWSDSLKSMTAIKVKMTVSCGPYAAQQPIMKMDLVSGSAPHMDYSGSRAIRAFDDEGSVPLLYEDQVDDPVRTWRSERATKGELILNFEATPRIVDSSVGNCPRSDMRENSGGIVSAGSAFIPKILLGGDETSEIGLNVTWDLSESPSGSQAAWTYGDGTDVKMRGTTKDLVNTVYIVAPKLYSLVDPSDPTYGFYWMTPPSANIVTNMTDLFGQTRRAFKAMEEYFKEPAAGFKVFLRESPWGYGGSSFTWSFIFEWDQGTRLGTTIGDTVGARRELFSLLTHESIHIWPTMESEYSKTNPNTVWYDEGIAMYLQAVLPYVMGVTGPEDFLANFNSSLSAYYTSPAINMSEEEAARLSFDDTHANRIPYYRGLLYLLHLDAGIRRASSNEYSLRDPVIDLRRLQREGRPYGIEDWKTIMGKYLPDAGWAMFETMSRGGWIVPPPDPKDGPVFGGPADVQYRLVYKEQRLYNRGFKMEFPPDGRTIVASVDPGGAADKAGIQVGDVLTWNNYRINQALDNPDVLIMLSIRRPDKNGRLGEEFVVEFLPREETLVPAWHYEVVES